MFHASFESIYRLLQFVQHLLRLLDQRILRIGSLHAPQLVLQLFKTLLRVLSYLLIELQLRSSLHVRLIIT